MQVGAVANMSALLMKQMLEDAEEQGASLAFDTSSVEDQCERVFRKHQRAAKNHPHNSPRIYLRLIALRCTGHMRTVRYFR